jgi:probable HAF family extracellular repeat protein
VPDPFAMFPTGTQTRTFLWEHGNLQDIGTLGGPDATPGPGCDNQRPGVIVGGSYTSFTPNAGTGVPTVDPFLWDNGTMADLGNLGGTISGGQCVNARLEIIGNSNLPGDQTFHAYRWRDGKMKDLGTLGGPDSEAIWINDAGEIAGSADLPTPGIHDAVIWRRGHIKDIGSLPGDACSRGRAINSWGQVVGGTSDCRNFLHAFVWEEGGPMRDLNKLIAPGSGLQITNAFNINDRGEILAKSFPLGTTPNDDEDLGHLVLLIPCGKEDREAECSDHDRPHDAATPPVSARAVLQAAVLPHSQHSLTAEDGAFTWQGRLARRTRVSNAITH